MAAQNEVKSQTEIKGETLDNKDKYVVRGGHVYVKTGQLLQSPKVKQQIEKIREIFQ